MLRPSSQAQVEQTDLPQGWRRVPFVEAIRDEKGRVAKIRRSDYRKVGRYPIIDQGQEPIAGFWDDDADLYRAPLPVIIFGDHTRLFKFVDFPFVVGADGTQILVPDTNRFDPSFLYFALLSLHIPSRGYNRHFGLLKERSVVGPSLLEQRVIAAVLRTVQRAEEACHQVLTATRQLKQSLLHHLFTYGLAPFDQADHVALKQTNAGLIPDAWEARKLDSVFELTSGKTRPTKLQENPDSKYPFPVFGGNGVMGYANRKLIDFDTIVLGRVGEYCGAVHLSRGPSWISDNALYAKRFIVKLDLDYLAAALVRLNLNQHRRKSSQPLITQGIVFSLSIPVPPLSEQLKIARQLASVDAKLAALKSRQTALGALFTSLLQNLMTGKARLPEFAS